MEQLTLSSYAQAGQDLFVVEALQAKRSGYYVEIGANHPIINNNTYLLEREFSWKGVGLDIDPSYYYEYLNKRINELVLSDATQFDFAKYFNLRDFPRIIDYASVDCEPPSVTLRALENLLASGYEFRVITFEHDLYANIENQFFKTKARELLKPRGYILAKENVHDGNPSRVYEDWYVLANS